MRKKLLSITGCMLSVMMIQAQTRYVEEVFDDSDIVVQADVAYGLNWQEFAPQTIGGPQLLPLFLDVYMPNPLVDTVDERPVMIYFHTGSFLPKGTAGPVGDKGDSAAVEFCQRFAKRGFVAISATYRVGWLANSTDLDLRRGSNLLAVYKAVQDAKSAVRFLRRSVAEQANPFGINEERIILMGQGSGGYITFAYGTLDKYSEIADFDKFQYDDNSSTGLFGSPVSAGDPYVDTTVVGDWDGYGGEMCLSSDPTDTTVFGLPNIDPSCSGRNYVNHPGYSSDVALLINLGGALGEETWMEQGDPAMISVHVVQDFFAPYFEGMVNVPIGAQFYDVVEVAGSYRAQYRAGNLGNNNVIGFDWNDDLSLAARSNPSFNPDGINHILPFDIPPPNPAAPFNVNSNPWDWWNPSEPGGSTQTNPNDKAQSIAYIDTITEFIFPRIKRILDVENLAIPTYNKESKFRIYPNPAQDILWVEVKSAKTEIQHIEVIDLSGKTVLRSENRTNRSMLDVSGLRSGMFILRIRTNEGIQTERFSVVH